MNIYKPARHPTTSYTHSLRGLHFEKSLFYIHLCFHVLAKKFLSGNAEWLLVCFTTTDCTGFEGIFSSWILRPYFTYTVAPEVVWKAVVSPSPGSSLVADLPWEEGVSCQSSALLCALGGWRVCEESLVADWLFSMKPNWCELMNPAIIFGTIKI